MNRLIWVMPAVTTPGPASTNSRRTPGVRCGKRKPRSIFWRRALMVSSVSWAKPDTVTAQARIIAPSGRLCRCSEAAMIIPPMVMTLSTIGAAAAAANRPRPLRMPAESAVSDMHKR